jgi:hypothetical protein
MRGREESSVKEGERKGQKAVKRGEERRERKTNGFLSATRNVERLPVEHVAAERVDGDDAVLEKLCERVPKWRKEDRQSRLDLPSQGETRRTFPFTSTSTLNHTPAPSPFSCIQVTASAPSNRIGSE